MLTSIIENQDGTFLIGGYAQSEAKGNSKNPLAKNAKGYQNLVKLSSLGYMEGLYSKWPRIDKELILQYHEGLIATTCCLGASVPQSILRDGEEAAEKEFKWWLDLFGEDYFIEIQRHNIKEQELINNTLLQFSKKFNVPVIQDSAQSTGAYYKGKRVGSVADLTCFSFYPTKNLSCWGDAGAVTGSGKYLETIRQLRNHGQSSRFKMNMVGWNARMDSIQAEVLINKLPELDKHNARRRAIATQYNGNLHGIVEIPVQNVNSTHVYHQYIICLLYTSDAADE
mgnify:CR=1 FL=1